MFYHHDKLLHLQKMHRAGHLHHRSRHYKHRGDPYFVRFHHNYHILLKMKDSNFFIAFSRSFTITNKIVKGFVYFFPQMATFGPECPKKIEKTRNNLKVQNNSIDFRNLMLLSLKINRFVDF